MATQAVSLTFHSLPMLPSELDVLIVRKEKKQSHRDLRVQRAVVHEALEWLPQNNKYYQAKCASAATRCFRVDITAARRIIGARVIITITSIWSTPT